MSNSNSSPADKQESCCYNNYTSSIIIMFIRSSVADPVNYRIQNLGFCQANLGWPWCGTPTIEGAAFPLAALCLLCP